MSLFATRVAELRKARGLTQQVLADKAGVSRQQVARWESEDRGAPQKRIPEICQALNVKEYQFWDPNWLPMEEIGIQAFHIEQEGDEFPTGELPDTPEAREDYRRLMEFLRSKYSKVPD